MTKIFNIKTFLFILLLGAVFLPHSVFASTVSVDAGRSDVYVGDTVLLNIRIDSENKDINAIDGELVLIYEPDALSLVSINTAGSSFSLWPNPPFPSEYNTSISFVGGSPGGLVSDDAIVFNLALNLKTEGTVTLSPNNIKVYLNDGNGTEDSVQVQDLVLNVLPQLPDRTPTNDWSEIVSEDKTPPASFKIIFGQDYSLFDNQYFISFFTTDEESGVAYYEVKEGGNDFAGAESPYLLTDQSLSGSITVKAVDKAGNERTESFRPIIVSEGTPIALNINILLLICAGLIVFAIIILIIWRNTRQKK